jgi:hypothetical protein
MYSGRMYINTQTYKQRTFSLCLLHLTIFLINETKCVLLTRLNSILLLCLMSYGIAQKYFEII